jgi:hypothetical protein
MNKAKSCLIGINGRIGSGKDTVGSIIQFLCAIKGSDTLNLLWGRDWYLSQSANYKHVSSAWEIKKFAGKLKQIASLLTGIPVDKFEDQDFKKTYLGEEWDWIRGYNHTANVFVKEKVQPGMEDRAKCYTVREFLQVLGTEAIRNNMHINTWVNALFADYKPKADKWDNDGSVTVQSYPKWIITDMRFPNELEAVKNNGGITIKITRQLPGVDYPTLEQLHPSETSLDTHVFDYTIQNNGTLDELEEKVKAILIAEKIL